jgi:HEAT repeat protein
VSFLFPSSTITFDAALRDLTSKNVKARAFAAHALGDVEDPTEKRRAVEALIAAHAHARPEGRAEAWAARGDLGELAAAPGLIKRLDDGSAQVRENAAIALGTLRAEDGFEPLLQALREGPANLRFQAATSIAEIDPRRAFDPLLAALSDSDPQVTSAAALALGVIPGRLEDKDLAMRARTALVEHLEHGDTATRFDVAYALADLEDPAGRNVLARGLGDPERAWDAVMQLARIGELDELAGALTDQSVPPEATVLAAGKLLAKRPPGDAEEPRAEESRQPGIAEKSRQPGIAEKSRQVNPAKRVLLAGLTARKTHVRGLAVEQLAEVGGEWAIAPLEAAAKLGKNEELREVIAAALLSIHSRQESGGPGGRK